MRSTHQITTNHGSFIALVMFITWLDLGKVLLETVILADFLKQFRMRFIKVQGTHRVWKTCKTWKNKIFWESHGKSWNFEKSSKVMEKSWNLENLTPIKHTSPSIINLVLIGFASHLVSCIHSNTSDYELLGGFEANPLVYCYWFLI